MDKKILEKEKIYLTSVFDKIDKLKDKNLKKIKQNKEKINYYKNFFAENFYDIKTGSDELADLNLQIENLENQNLLFQKEANRLTKQKKSPYFGRFDFKQDSENESKKYYIGLGLVQDENNENLVYDWRADVCSLYYDDHIGKNKYTCLNGDVSGEVTLKRQYKIENDKLIYYIDSNLIIDDDILMETLSKNASSKMHEIVSTIQKEQNVLIRAEDFENTIVQGVAGSGKTSIAMHRVSYLLYKYRNQLKSEDILILSPSEIFADYINEVLPSLGEEKTFTTTFSEIAKRLLGQEFETREEMLERVIGKQSQKDFENIAIKSSFEFLNELKKFLNKNICNLFIPKSMIFGDIVISKDEISDIYFNRLKNLPIYKRVDVLAEFITDKFHIPRSRHADLQKRAKKLLYNKFITTDLIKIYNLFLQSQGIEEIEKIGAYDIAPILLIKENLLSLKNNFDAKYVIVDEMQDYTPCHFYLFDKIWKCSKLYLGDINQSIDRTLPQSYLVHLAKQTKSKIKYLTKSYRSTLQISLFAQKILGHKIANNVNRNGEEVECIKTRDYARAIEKILEKRSENKDESIAIICKTKNEIKELQKESQIIKKFKVLSSLKTTNSKRIITTPANAKGVEFDCVIIPYATEENYNNELDRNLLYVSATRALHKLFFLTTKKPSKFLIKKN